MIAESERSAKKQGKRRNMHPNSLKNLEKGPRWKKGQSGNAGGPPRARIHLWDYIRQYAAMDPEELKALDIKGL